MKLAEALALRADRQKKIEDLRKRLAKNAKVQEGETPSEHPDDLLRELDSALEDLNRLVKQINKTNSQATITGEQTLTEALPDRETLALKRSVFKSLIEGAELPMGRYTRYEIKFYSTFDVPNMQKRLDDLSRDYRELDIKIQAVNWSVDLKTD